MISIRDVCLVLTGMVIYRLVYEYYRLKHKAGEK